jgi:hypothetical protein
MANPDISTGRPAPPLGPFGPLGPLGPFSSFRSFTPFRSFPPFRSFAAVLLLGFCATGAVGDSADDWARMKPIVPAGYVCYRAAQPVNVDGRLDDASWMSPPWTAEFADIEGSLKPRPRFRTRVKMLWDDEYFYIAAEMEEPHVWGTLTDHDAVIFHDNDFEVFIDPNGDNHEYYELELNALNTTWDLFLPRPYKDGGRADNTWEIPGMKTAVQVQGTLNDPADNDQGWTVEIALPWHVLGVSAHRRAPPQAGDQWRVNFSRVQWQHEIQSGTYRKVPDTREDNWVWSPQGIIDMHRPERWGYVQFSTSPSGTDPFRADPSSPVRDALMEIYHHQKSYFQKHQRWAASLDELALSGELPGSPALTVTEQGFEAVAQLRAGDGRRETWSVRQDSLLVRKE